MSDKETAGLITIWPKLTRISVRKISPEEAWIYDQLLGAALALSKAEDIGAPDGVNPDLYREDPCNLCDPQSLAYKQFAWGFYVNSAIHRVVWACERLRGIKTNRQRAQNARRAQSADDTILNKCKNGVTYDAIVDKNNVLAILGERVNRQKHHISNLAHRQTSGDASHAAAWDDLLPGTQYCFVIHALELVIVAFWEQVNLGLHGTECG